MKPVRQDLRRHARSTTRSPCVDAGADALGFNFWPQSKRHIPVEARGRDRRGACRPNVRTVGVFVEPDRGRGRRAPSRSGAIDLAQLHGDETPEFCRRFAGRYIKALRLRDAASLAAHGATIRATSCSSTPTRAGYGGSGQRADVDAGAPRRPRRGA